MTSIDDGVSQAYRQGTQSTHVEGARGLQLGDSPEPEDRQQSMLQDIQAAVAAAHAYAAAAGTADASVPVATTPTASQQHADHHSMRAEAAFLLNATHTSSHDSAGTGQHLQQAAHQQHGSPRKGASGQGFVPRKDSNDNIPCFVQTSALFTNMCGYCGTRSTSGCWRRGWEIGPNKFINLCNKCGLRHKAGKLPSVPEPPPPQLRGRAAAAAAAAAGGGSSPSGGGAYEPLLQHSTSAADLMLHLMTGQGQGSPHFSSGHEQHAAASSDPTAAGGRKGHGAGATSSGGRRRRAQKPLTPKWSRVGAPAGEYQQDQHMFAALAAGGAFSNSGPGLGVEVYGGGMMPEQQQQNQHQQHQQHQQQLAALLQSLAGEPSPSQQGVYGPFAAPDANNHQQHMHQIDATHSHGLAPSHRAALAGQHSQATTGTQLNPAGPSSSAAAVAAAAPSLSMDSAQAVAAVLAAAAAAPSTSGPPPLKLSKLSVVSGTSALDSNGQLASPAAKKRRTKKGDAAGEDAGVGQAGAGAAGAGGGTAAAQRAQDAAAAGDAADALLALRSSAKPESPSWANLQQLPIPTSMPARVAPGMDALGLTSLATTRQVTSPSVDTTSKPSPLAHYLQPLHTPTHPGALAHPQMPPPPHAPHPTAALFTSASHLQPLGTLNHHPASPASWTPDQVQAWLQHVGCGEAAAPFKALGIDGQAFSGLLRVAADAGAARLDDRLNGEFGVSGVALRLRLVDKIMGELALPVGAYRGQH